MLFEDSTAPRLVGIARLAAQSPTLEAKQRVEYLEIETRNFIGRCSGTRMPFVWTVNPYRGCEFGCKYCYARYAHEFMELRDPRQFETRIFAKQFDAHRFSQELKKVKNGESLWIGTATDPYQPAERRYSITRKILRVLAKEQGLKIGITTKSDLVARDAALLGDMRRRSIVHINITITTVDEKLARLVEPFAPRPALRLKAVRELADAGVRVTVLGNPVMPLITDSEQNLDAVCGAAASAGAVSFGAAPLFLKPCSKAVFIPFLERNFPHLVRRYRERFDENAYLRGHYPEMIRERVQAINARHKMGPRDQDYLPEQFAEQQLSLW
ncbi:MAG TPA: radical SAM protein [Bryobacteraceae bacterium]|nr:radical SAM protein [Bryobacteraceae bacterium]